VYSAKGQQIREVFISIPADGSPLGLALQWSPLTTTEAVWHILDVIPNSPADVAGLLPYSDYVIGSPEGLMRGDSGLSELIEDVRREKGTLQSLRLTESNSSSTAHSDCTSTTTNTT
jgi:C-terminal processing protease CtpA/Prc